MSNFSDSVTKSKLLQMYTPKRIKLYIAYFHNLNMGMKNSLLSSPRERSGSKTSNRYAYQKNWTICKLLELHEKEENYCVLVELHDDVVILDSDENPQSASFFQIKTREKPPWSIGLLTKKTGNSSMLGKLYQNRIKFGSKAEKLFFVSNSYYDLDLEDKTKKSKHQKCICLHEIDPKLTEKLITKLSSEFGIEKEEIDPTIIFLERSELDINSHEDATKGKIGDFLEKSFKDIRYKIGVIYRSLFDEVKRKTNREFDCQNFEEVLKFKTISKKDFEEILKTIITSFSDNSWELVSKMLINENLPIHDIRKIKIYWDKYEIERMNPNALALQKLRKNICEKLEENEEKFVKCGDLLMAILPIILAQNETKTLFDDFYVKAIILAEYFSNETTKI